MIVEALAAVAFAFGREGGNIIPFQVTISPAGAVQVSGPVHVKNARLGAATMTRLRKEISLRGIVGYRGCPGTNPDVATQHVTAGGRTAQLHGSCSAQFARDWKLLAHAVGISY